MKTKDRIVQASRELFNDFGVHAITTNHIAAHLGISPGNLYYHFRNKEDIIRSIYANYVDQMNASFIVDHNEMMTLSQIAAYAEQVIINQWEYRFFYSGITDILQRDDSIKERYLDVILLQLEKGRAIIEALRAASLIEIEDGDIGEVAELLRLTESFNVAYMQCKSSEEPGISAAYNTVVKLLMILKPYATAQSKPDFSALIETYRHKTDAKVTQTA